MSNDANRMATSPSGAAITQVHVMSLPYAPEPSDSVPIDKPDPSDPAPKSHGQVPEHVDSPPANTAGEYLPAPQSWQASAELAPRAPEYLPAAQFRHVESMKAPSVVEYLPSTQSWHVALEVPPGVVEYLP